MTIQYGHLEIIYNLMNSIRNLRLYGADNLKKYGVFSKLDHELASFENSRMDVIKKHANLDKEGKPKVVSEDVKDEEGNVIETRQKYDIPEEKAAECNAEINELRSQEVEVEFTKIKWSAVINACEENPDLTPDWTELGISALEPVIDFSK